MGNRNSSNGSLIVSVTASSDLFPEISDHPDFLNLIKAINANILLVHQDPLYKKALSRNRILNKLYYFLMLIPLICFILLILSWFCFYGDCSKPPILEIFLFFGSIVGLIFLPGIISCLCLDNIDTAQMIIGAAVPLVNAWNQSHQDEFIIYKPQSQKSKGKTSQTTPGSEQGSCHLRRQNPFSIKMQFFKKHFSMVNFII